MYLYVYSIYIYTKSYIDIRTQNHMSTKENIYIHTKVAQRLEEGPGDVTPIGTTFHQATLSPISEAPKCPWQLQHEGCASWRILQSLDPSCWANLEWLPRISNPEFPIIPDSWGLFFAIWKFSPSWRDICDVPSEPVGPLKTVNLKPTWTQNHFSMLLKEHTHHDCHIIHVCYLHTMEPSWWQPSPMHLPCTARRRCWWRSFGFGQQAVSGSSTQMIHTCDGGTKS